MDAFFTHTVRSTTRLRLLVALAVLLAVLGGLTYSAKPTYARPMAFNQGEVLVGVGTGKIKRFDSNGNLLQTLNTGQGSTEDTGMCFDATGNLLATNFSVNSISKFDSAGTLLGLFGSGLGPDPESCVRDQAGNIYVGQADNAPQDVLKFNGSGNLLASYNVTNGSRGADWIDLAGDQCTLFYTSEDSVIRRYNVCTSTQLANFATISGVNKCYALRLRSNDELIVGCPPKVYRLSSSGSVIQSYGVFPTWRGS